MLEFDKLQPLTNREATPLLKNCVVQKKIFQAIIDFALETFSSIHDPSIDVVAVSHEHSAVRAVDGLWQQQKRLRNRHERLALFSSLHDAFGLAFCD